MKVAWLIEATNTPYRWPQYLDVYSEITSDPWRARRFDSKTLAENFISYSDMEADEEQWKPIEHGFETEEEEVIRRLEHEN